MNARMSAAGIALVEVGIIEEDRGRLAAQLKRDALHRRGAIAHDGFAHGHRARERDFVHVRIAHELGADDIPPARDDVEKTPRQLGLMQSLDQHLRLQRAQLARLDDDGTACGNGRGQLEANEQRVRIPRGNQAGHADRLQGHGRLAPTAGQRHLLKRLFGGLERRDARLHNQSGELHDTAVFFHHGGRQIVDARRSGRMQPAQDLHAFFLRRSAVSREGPPGRGDRAPRILFVGQRDAADGFAACRADDVHDLAAMGLNERAVDVVRREGLISLSFVTALIAFLLALSLERSDDDSRQRAVLERRVTVVYFAQRDSF